jgi:hypothetical protein
MKERDPHEAAVWAAVYAAAWVRAASMVFSGIPTSRDPRESATARTPVLRSTVRLGYTGVCAADTMSV